MEALIKIAQDFGPLGLIVLACFWYIVKKDKVIERQHKEALEVTRSNTTVLTEIATLIRRG